MLKFNWNLLRYTVIDCRLFSADAYLDGDIHSKYWCWLLFLFLFLFVDAATVAYVISITLSPVGGRSIAVSVSMCLFVCLSVCLSVRSYISQHTCPHFTKFSVRVNCGRGSIVFWRQCNTLCISGFVDDVVYDIMERMGQNQRRRVYVSSSSQDGGTCGEICRLRLRIIVAIVIIIIIVVVTIM